MNEMKKILNLWLLAALVCGLGLGVTSCKDDDDDSKSEEQQQQEQEERASKFWSVVGQLVSSDDYAADYEDKTFEPVYGIADATNETTRIVETNDMQTAAQRFSDLVGASIDENTPSYTYSDPEVGTLTYTRGGTADDWATVDVSIKQVPRLRKIIYREGGEGTNASFAGKAWYRFGDVVSRTLDDGKVEYWICVRPAFGPEKKGDSHWVCLNYLPPKNFFNYSYDSKSWTMPTGIGTDKENMQNLAEMLYAIIHPEQWYNNANTYHTDGKLWGFSGLPIFADFKKANVMYHNQYFWQKVAEAWERNEVANDAFGIDFEVLSDHLEQEGLNLLYEGYQWWFKTSWNCKLWQASYTNGTKNDEKNLHHAEYKDISKNMKEIPFDCREMGALKQNYNKFFDNDGKYRWVIRHATGADLNNGSQPAPTSRLQGKGVKDFYRYYEEYEDEWTKPGPDGKSDKPEVTGDESDSRCYYHAGDVVRYKNRLYICASDHILNGEARFITLNDQDDHTIGTFNWSGVGKDSVYTDDMASAQTLACWVKNVLYDDNRYKSVRAALQAKGIDPGQWDQVIPETDQKRYDAQFTLMDQYKFIIDCTQEPSSEFTDLVGSFKASQMSNVIYHECEGDELSGPDFDPDDEANIWKISCGLPLFLANKVRYSDHLTGSSDYWMPYIFIEPEKWFQKYEQRMNDMPCLSTLSPSHFKWADLGVLNIPAKIKVPDGMQTNGWPDISAGKYHILLVAVYWRHEMVVASLRAKWRILMNATVDFAWKGGKFVFDESLWDRRSITSREYVVTDNGKKNSRLESVAVQKEQ